MTIEVVTLDAGGDSNRTYVVLPGEGDGVEAWCVDPSYGAGAVAGLCQERARRLTHVLLTHTHPDHVAGVRPLRERSQCQVWCHASEAARIAAARPIAEDGPLPGLRDVEAIHTPGHTPGGVCYRIGDHLFTGDTLFVDWVGRADLPGGDPAALFSSLERLRSLPGSLVIHPGHHYGSVPSRTLAEEVRANRFLSCPDYAQFVRLLPELTE